MKMLKKLLLVSVVTIIMLCIVSFTASAETYSGTCGDNLTWNLDTETGVLEITGTGKMFDWEHHSNNPWYAFETIIKRIIITDGITNIGDNAFSFCENLTQITMSDSVKIIGNGAFWYCESLTDLSLSSNIEVIGEGAFFCCSSLINLDIANKESLKTIGRNAFTNCCSLVNVIIPDNVLLIGEEAFAACTNVVEVIIGNKVESIGVRAFSHCENLTKITIPTTIKTIEEEAFYYSFQLSEVNYLGDLAGWFSINFVGDYSNPKMTGTKIYFNGKPLKGNITIPDNVTIIPNGLFEDCIEITGITIPESVEFIEYGAFSDCDNLSNIVFDENSQLKYIGSGAFEGCNSLKSIIIPEGCEIIGAGAFSDCNKLEKITISGSVTAIGEMAFALCPNLEIIEVNSNNQYFSSSKNGILFNKDKSILIQYPAKCLGDYYEIPISVKEIKEYAFNYSENLVNIVLTDNVEQIGAVAFGACFNLEYVHIPSSVVEIGEAILSVTTAYICSDTEDCYAKEYAEAYGYEFRLCDGHGHTHEHAYTAEITQTATATQNCIITYTCSCGDSYTTESFANGFNLSSTANVDFNNDFIFGLSVGVDSLGNYTSVVAEGFEWVYELTDNGFGTGTTAKLTNGETVLSEYTILIYGDTDGDGWYDGNDAFLVNLIVNGMLDRDDVGEAVWTAADCNHDGVIDEKDFDLLTGAGLLLNNVDQSATQAELEANSFYIEYMGLIDQSVEITPDSEANDTTVDDNVGNGLDRSENENNFEIFFADIIAFIKQIFSFIFSLIFN